MTTEAHGLPEAPFRGFGVFEFDAKLLEPVLDELMRGLFFLVDVFGLICLDYWLGA